nr:unnamed protein product [Spirometra erinaceieuropaei]
MSFAKNIPDEPIDNSNMQIDQARGEKPMERRHDEDDNAVEKTHVVSSDWLALVFGSVGTANTFPSSSKALAVLGRARRQHQNCFDGNDAAISKLLAAKNYLHEAFVDCPTDDNRDVFYRSRCPLQHRGREMEGAWTARKAEEI